MSVTTEKENLIKEILIACKTNNVPTGELFFSLASMSLVELKKVCQELYIKIN